jgi:flagellar hook-associated protein 1 FlgK
MSGLLTSLATAGGALRAYQQALDVAQNNIDNANTPGYASQSLNLAALPFDLTSGLAGGVAARGLLSARDEYADEAVRHQMQLLGKYQMQAQATSSLANEFDATGNSGVPAQLNQLFQSFSAWSVSPNSTSARQSVLDAADNLAGGVRALASSLTRTGQDLQKQIGSTVQQINQLTTQIAQYNAQRLQGGSSDPSLDAQAHNALEQLSQLVDLSAVTQADGTMTLVLSGGSPLVVGTSQFALEAQNDTSSHILDSQGQDVTAQITGGNLEGLLDAHNRVLASVMGDGTQPGSLNTFAQSLADTVNGILASGTVSTDVGAAAGLPLFTYDPTGAAGSLAINPSMTPADLAPVDSSGNANGNALQLAALSGSYTDSFSAIASALGNESANAAANEQAQQQVTDQTKSQRDQISAVSLDEQAILVTQFQNSYQAAAKVISTLNDLTQTTLDMVQ